MKRFFEGFPRDAHPMAVLSSAVSALSTFYQDSLDPFDRDHVDLSTVRLMAKIPTIASYAFKKAVGQPMLYPDNSLGYVENFLRMTFGVPATPYEVDPVMVRVLDMLFVLHADHEQNCSTSTVRLVGSSNANLFASVSAGVNALFGPLHGGANQAVLEMLQRIHDDGDDVGRVREPGEEQGARGQADGLRAPGLQELRPTGDDREEGHPRGPRGPREARPVAGHRDEARRGRARRRLLRLAQALSQRRLLHRRDLQGDGLPDPHVHGAVRDGPAARLDRSVARDDRGPGDQDRPAPAGLRRRDRARLRLPGCPGGSRTRAASSIDVDDITGPNKGKTLCYR